MSLYAAIFGESGVAGVLLETLELSRDSFYRYRDCYLAEGREIAVYTRGGGNNRDCYCEGAGAHGVGCVVPTQEALRRHPLYLRDTDDAFDCTYCTFYFKVPAGAAEKLSHVTPEPGREEMWNEFLAILREAGDTHKAPR